MFLLGYLKIEVFFSGKNNLMIIKIGHFIKKVV